MVEFRVRSETAPATREGAACSSPTRRRTATFAARRHALLRTAFLLTGDWHLAEDLVQITLIKLYLIWSRVYRSGDVDAYARKTLVNAYLDERRRPWRREKVTDAVPERGTPDADLDSADPGTRQRLRVALGRVPALQRAALVLRYWEDLSVEQVAEPDHVAPVHEDLARGRRARIHRRRRRIAGTALVGAAATAAVLAVPVSPMSFIGGDRTELPPATGSPAVPEDPATLAVWRAVEAALPDDVEVDRDGGSVAGGLYVPLVRDDYSFGVTIWIAGARPDLDEFRPCSEPTPTDFYAASNCQEGYDEDGRWRVMAEADDGRIGVSVLEGDSTSVTLRWDRLGYPPPDCEGDVCQAISESDIEIVGNLSPDEVDAITAAVWDTANRDAPAAFEAEIDLPAVPDVWPELVTALESELGIGEFDSAGSPGLTVDIDGSAGSVSANYETADGVTVDMVVWQKERIYDPFCMDQWCNFLPDTHLSSGEPTDRTTEQPPLGEIVELGARGGIVVWVHSSDPSVTQGLHDVIAQLEQLILDDGT